MRSNATQSSPAASPHVRVTIGADIYNSEGAGGDERVFRIQSNEQVWGGIHRIFLDNSDGALDSKDYKGLGCYLYFGFVGVTGSTIGVLWVDNQQSVSEEGRMLLQLDCIDAWGLLSRIRGMTGGMFWNQSWQDPDYLADQKLPYSGDDIPQDIIDKFAAHWEKNIKEIVNGTMAASLELPIDWDDLGSDSYLTDEYPIISSSDLRSLIAQAMSFSKSYLLWKADARFHQVTPDAHGVVYTYNLGTYHFNTVEEQLLVVPNRVRVWYIDKTDPNNWVWATADSVDSESYDRLQHYIDEHYNLEWDLLEAAANEAEAQARADARMARLKLSKATGSLIAPMHCSQELFDAVQINDDRYSPTKTITGYVFGILREYDRGVYRITLQLGGVESGYTPPGGGDIRVEKAPVPSPAPVTDWGGIPAGHQAYIAHVTVTPTAWNAVSWSAGTIQLGDGRTQPINAGSLTNMLAGAYYLYCVWGNSTLQSSQSYSDAVGEDRMLVAVASRGSSTAVMAYALNPHTDSILINRDKVMDGLVNDLKLADEAVTNVKLGYRVISEDKIATDAIIARTIQTDAVTAAKIKAGAVTAIKIDVATLDAISANVGTLTSGTINGVTIYAGGGSVKLDANGITFDNAGGLQICRFKYGTYAGFVWLASSGQLIVEGSQGVQLRTDGGVRVVGLREDGEFRPGGEYSLGSSSYKWGKAFFNSDIYGKIFRPENSTSGGLIFQTSAKGEEGSIKIKGASSGDIYIYSGGAWRINT